jgi:hypothetical protein
MQRRSSARIEPSGYHSAGGSLRIKHAGRAKGRCSTPQCGRSGSMLISLMGTLVGGYCFGCAERWRRTWDTHS